MTVAPKTESVRAFTRLGAFNRGEDDLRYYYAVSLFEIGKYDDAKQELAAALPNLQRTRRRRTLPRQDRAERGATGREEIARGHAPRFHASDTTRPRSRSSTTRIRL
jgi:hypothetical protein